MTYTPYSFQVFATIPGATAGTYRALASYSTNDTAAAVETAAYFSDEVAHLPVGSQIFVAGDLDGTPFQKTYVVSANDGTDVTIVAAATANYAANYALTAHIADVSTAGQIYVAVPYAGEVLAVYAALNGTISGADVDLTVKAPDGTIGTMTFGHHGSAAGDVESLTGTLSNTTVAAGEVIEIETDGASTGTEEVTITILIGPS